MDELPDDLRLPILLKMGDNISTDEILAGGSRVLPYRSNLPEISKFSFEIIDPTYYQRGKDSVDEGGHMIVGGFNYGQGSSREHAALDRKSTRLNSSHVAISYAVFCLKKKKTKENTIIDYQ